MRYEKEILYECRGWLTIGPHIRQRRERFFCIRASRHRKATTNINLEPPKTWKGLRTRTRKKRPKLEAAEAARLTTEAKAASQGEMHFIVIYTREMSEERWRRDFLPPHSFFSSAKRLTSKANGKRGCGHVSIDLMIQNLKQEWSLEKTKSVQKSWPCNVQTKLRKKREQVKGGARR